MTFFFNIHVCELDFLINGLDTANQPEDTSKHAASRSVADVINYTKLLLKCYIDNNMKSNRDKSHLLLNTGVAMVTSGYEDIISDS